MSEPSPPRKWRGESRADDRERSRRDFLRRITALRMALLFVAMGLVGLLAMIRPMPRTALVMLWSTGPPGLVLQDAVIPGQEPDRLTSSAHYSSVLGLSTSTPDQRSMRDLIDRLGDLRYNGAVVVSVAGPARLDPSGSVCLLPADSDPADPSSWIVLSDVLDAVSTCRSNRKMLILEIAAPLAGLSSGVLIDDVSDWIARERATSGMDDAVLVLTSCAPGQVAGGPGPDGRSAFAYFLERGLAGQADRADIGDENGVVSARELSRYVADRVADWTRRSGRSIQTPVLTGQGDFPLVVARGSNDVPVSDATDPGPIGAYPDGLLQAWQRRDGLRSQEIDRLVPGAFRRWEAALLAADRAWRAGEAPDRIRNGPMVLAADLERRVRQASAIARRSAPAPQSLAMAEVLGQRPGDQAAEVLKTYLDSGATPDSPTPPSTPTSAPIAPSTPTSAPDGSARNGAGQSTSTSSAAPSGPAATASGAPGGSGQTGTPGGSATGRSGQGDSSTSNAANTTAPTQPSPAPAADAPAPKLSPWQALLSAIDSLPPDAASWLAFHAVADDPSPEAEAIRALDARLFGRLQRFTAIEAIALHRLARSESSASGARAYLDLVQLIEASWASPEAFPWLGAVLWSGSLSQHEAEILLMAPGFGSGDEAFDSRRQEAIARGHQAETAWKLIARRNAALAMLPDIAVYLEREPSLLVAYTASLGKPVPPLLDVWEKAVLDAKALDAALASYLGAGSANPPEASTLRQSLTEARRHALALTERLAILRGSFADEPISWLLGESTDQAASGRGPGPEAGLNIGHEIEALLATPILSASMRARLNEAFRSRVESPGKAGADRSVPSNLMPRPSDLAARRADLALDLLTLAGATEEQLQPVVSWLRKARANPGDRALWAGLGIELRRAWDEQAERATTGTDLAEADRRIRVLPSWLLPGSALADGNEPAVQIRERRWIALRDENARRFRRLASDVDASVPEAVAFYRDAALSYQTRPLIEDAPNVRITLPGGPPVRRGDSTGQTVTMRVEVIGGPPDRATRLEVQLLGPEGTDPPVQFLSLGPGQTATMTDRDGPSASVSMEVQPPRTIDLPMVVSSSSSPVDSSPTMAAVVLASFDDWTYGRVIPVGAAPTTSELTVLIGPSDGPSIAANRLRLRPVEQPQPYSLSIRNEGTVPRKVRATVSIGDTRFPPVNLAAIPPGGSQPLTIAPPGNPAATDNEPSSSPGAETASASPASDSTSRGQASSSGPPPIPVAGSIRIRLADTDNPDAPTATHEIVPLVDEPAEYVRLIEGVVTPTGLDAFRLDATLAARRVLYGPPCPVLITVPADRNPGLRADPGSQSQSSPAKSPTLPPDGTPLPLELNGLRIDPASSGVGEVHVAIDGVPRALIYRTAFVPDGQPTRLEPMTDLRLRLVCPEQAAAGDPLPVTIEVDNAPPGSSLVVGFGRSRFQVDIPSRRLEGPKQRRVFLSVGTGGTLMFQASLGDWRIALPTAGQDGPRYAWVRLLGADGAELATDARPVLIDGQAPGDLRFVDLPSPVMAGKPLEVRASGEDRGVGIKTVAFFLGPPGPDGSPPQGTSPVSGIRVPGAPPTWKAALPLPSARLGPVPVSAVFTDSVGHSRTISREVEIVSELPTQPASIVGKVLHGDRPQSDLTVELFDAKDMKQGEATTRPDGTYAFPNLDAGTYRLQVIQPASADRAVAQVTLRPGESKTVTLSLSRLGQPVTVP